MNANIYMNGHTYVCSSSVIFNDAASDTDCTVLAQVTALQVPPRRTTMPLQQKVSTQPTNRVRFADVSPQFELFVSLSDSRCISRP